MDQINRMLTLRDVMKMTGLSRSTIYAYMTIQMFPNRVPLGIRRVGWSESEVLNWINDKISKR